MNDKRLTDLLQNPEIMDSGDLKALENSVKEYPFYQLAHVLLLHQLKKDDPEKFDSQLRISAIHIPDRKKLYNLLFHYNTTITAETVKEEINQTLQVDESVEFQFDNTKPEITIDEKIDQSIPLSDAPKIELLEIDELSDAINDAPETEISSENVSSEDTEDIEDESLDKKFSLIEKFIEKNPAFTPNKLDLNEIREDISVNSIQEDDSLVTETLATIFEMQKLYEKAIDIYEKLILKFPEKSTYFASRINELKQNIK
jgi:hypothetical protein